MQLKLFNQGLENGFYPWNVTLITPHNALSGVPQGSILGRSLFVLFINKNSIGLSPGTNIMFSADDTKIWREMNDENDFHTIQRDIDDLLDWALRLSVIQSKFFLSSLFATCSVKQNDSVEGISLKVFPSSINQSQKEWITRISIG
jgi:hypothetical protein